MVVKTLLGKHVFHIGLLDLMPWLCSQIYLPANAHPAQQPLMDQVRGSLPTT